jgi:hypothetical protein
VLPDSLSPIGFWTPTVSDIARLERDLSTYLVTQDTTLAQQPRQPWTPLRNYYRQYVGIVVVGGGHLIYVNAVAPAERDHLVGARGDTAAWRYVPALVCDGGWALWGVESDPATHRFRGFAFNGEA